MGVISYLSIGSNLGDRVTAISESLELIQKHAGDILSISKWYETEALGFDSENKFINLCIKIETLLSPFQLLMNLNDIEKELGRKRNGKGYIDRTIDIDIIFFEERQFETKFLTIPHPHFQSRKFVLQPLTDIAGRFIDPRSHLTIRQLLKNCTDQSEIYPFIIE